MKTVLYKVLLLIILPIVFTQCEKEPGPITIPDDNFLNALIELGVDTNGDSIISPAEAEVITYLNVNSNNISDMTGIEAFINLDTLWCSWNQLTSLYVSKNTALENLCCGLNQLTGLDVSKNTLLTHLECGSNQLTGLDVSKNTLLTNLECGSNQLTGLDVSKNTLLTYLDCRFNQLTSLDVSNNTLLTRLVCWHIPLTSLDVSNNTLLTRLDCWHNQLTSLDVSKNTALGVLICGSNQLSGLDISNNSYMIFLDIKEMPSLYEVCVWEMPFPPAGVDVYTDGSPNVYFTTECSGGN